MDASFFLGWEVHTNLAVKGLAGLLMGPFRRNGDHLLAKGLIRWASADGNLERHLLLVVAGDVVGFAAKFERDATVFRDRHGWVPVLLMGRCFSSV